MAFHDIYLQNKDFDLENNFSAVTFDLIQEILLRDNISVTQFISLLSPQAESSLEIMAQRAHALTQDFFGKTIQLYAPLYLSNYCDNSCLYCGFNLNNNIKRRVLALEEVEKEAQFISASGLKHILILTGESRAMSPVSYIKDCVGVLKKYFTSVSIEVYPLTDEEYAQIVACGVDGLTIYQEVYDEEIYAKMHIKGPKKDYKFRLGAPERGARAKMRNISIGVLLGLGDWRREVFFLGLHAKYLQDNFPDVEFGIAVPRIQPPGGGLASDSRSQSRKPRVSDFKPISRVSDKNITQIITALRIFLPRLGITLSTRESPVLRENLLPLGITRISAGSVTNVGGYTLEEAEGGEPYQFKIQDQRGVSEIKAMLENKGYQPVFKDWLSL